jgi:hypothetical protein
MFYDLYTSLQHTIRSGHMIAAFKYKVYDDSGYISGIDPTCKIKLATADTDLSLGQHEYAAQVNG